MGIAPIQECLGNEPTGKKDTIGGHSCRGNDLYRDSLSLDMHGSPGQGFSSLGGTQSQKFTCASSLSLHTLEVGPLGGIASTGPLAKMLHLPPGRANAMQVALHSLALLQQPCCVLTHPERAISDCNESQSALSPVQQAYRDSICLTKKCSLLPYLPCLLVQHDCCEQGANMAVSAKDMRIHLELCCLPEEHGPLGWMQLMRMMNELLRLH